MNIYFASDHAGFEYKKELMKVIPEKCKVIDMGPFEYDEDDDYPDFISKCAKKVAEDKNSLGIILGGSGQGEAIVANRYKGVRAIVYQTHNLEIIKIAKEHNNANVLSIGARFVNLVNAKEAVNKFINSNFSGAERHVRRINKIDNL